MSVVMQLPSETDRLIVSIDLAVLDCASAFACWVDPHLLMQWWPPQAEVAPHVGGRYHLAWPKMDQHLRGVYTVFDLPHQLTFTWKWDHDPETTLPIEVNLTFEPITTGTRLTLVQGLYGPSKSDQQLRIEHHLAGWSHFLPRLANIRV